MDCIYIYISKEIAVNEFVINNTSFCWYVDNNFIIQKEEGNNRFYNNNNKNKSENVVGNINKNIKVIITDKDHDGFKAEIDTILIAIDDHFINEKKRILWILWQS